MGWLSSIKSGFSAAKALGSKIWDGAGRIGQKITNGLHDKRLKGIVNVADMLTGNKYNLGGYLTTAQDYAKSGMQKYKGISNVMNGKSDGKPNKNRDIMPHTQPQADISRGQTSQNRYSKSDQSSSKNSIERHKPPVDKNEDYLGNLFA